MWWILCAFAQPHNAALEEALALVKRCHVDGDQQQLINQKILTGGLRALDPYSAYFPPEEYRKVQQMAHGALLGVGLEIKADQNRYVVQHVIDGTPAAKAGIKIGDVLTHIDGMTIAPLTPPDMIMAQLHGKPGTVVIVGINGKHIKITRSIVHVPSVCASWTVKKKQTLVLRVRFFCDTTATELWRAIECHVKKGIQNVVLDLRSNPGGSLEAAVETVGVFMNTAVVVHIESRLPEYNKTYMCQGKAPYPSIPLTVWIDRHTASAAEVVVATLDDHKRAKIIGGPSFGKGCIQDFFDLPKGYGGMKLTVGYCFSPFGKAIHRQRCLC
ncbi:MAG: S41 family peptidase [Pseudomonadota bacterium]